MSEKQEHQESTQEQESAPAAANESAGEVHIVNAMKPSSAPSTAKPLRYGTRKKRVGGQAPAVKNVSSVNMFEEEEIEMDDLPVRANAPEHLIDSRPAPSERRRDDGEDRPRRESRPREERRGRSDRPRSSEKREPRQNRESRPPRPQREPEEAAETAASTEQSQPETQRGDRPERFAMVDEKERQARAPQQVQEFRPSRDGRKAPPREVNRDRPRRPQPKKQGILSKIIALFTGGDKKEAEKKVESRRDSGEQRRRGGQGRRGPENRRPREAGAEGEGPRRKRRPRNRKPRQDGDAQRPGEGNRPNREGGNRSRPRRPRRQGEGRRDSGRVPSE